MPRQVKVADIFVNMITDGSNGRKIGSLSAAADVTDISIDSDNRITLAAGNDYDIITFSAICDRANSTDHLKFLGLAVVDDLPNNIRGNRREWGAPMFGKYDYSDEEDNSWFQSTVSVFLTDDDDNNFHDFTLTYYDADSKTVKVYDPGIKDQY